MTKARINGPMEIAPRVTAVDWQNADLTTESGWLQAIGYLEQRIEMRFLAPARTLLALPHSGFAVLALDSLLVETLQQFVAGVDETPPRKAPVYFNAFLARTAFGGNFPPHISDLFRDTIRNGILHKAEVKRSSRVLRNVPLVSVTPSGDGIIINPVKFHALIENAFKDSLEELKQPDNPLRITFRAKMEFIAGKNHSPYDSRHTP